MENCIFCDILAGKASAHFVERNQYCAAFMDIHPVNPGHVLVVPVAHSELLAGVDPITLGQMLSLAQRVDSALRSSEIKCEGVNLFLADGRSAGQEVMHVHLHVIPRFRGDGHHMRFSPGYLKHPSQDEIQSCAAQIRQQMRGAL
jgi:histidine triad (HIT) family protein